MNYTEILRQIIIAQPNNRTWIDSLYSVVILTEDIYQINFSLRIPNGMHDDTAMNAVVAKCHSPLGGSMRVIAKADDHMLAYSEHSSGFSYIDIRVGSGQQLNIAVLSHDPMISSLIPEALTA